MSYDELEKALVPQRDRLEVGLVFDSALIDAGWYGYEVAERVMPLLPRDLVCSVLSGDLLIEDQELGFDLLQTHLTLHSNLELSHTSQLYCVYVNNLSRTMFETITTGLRTYEPFAGYVDVSTASPMKDWLSLTLVAAYVKAGNVVLAEHEDDVPETEDQNTLGWPWEDHGYECRSLPATPSHVFLTYKIERRTLRSESDTDFALTAISGRPFPLRELPMVVEEAKREYLARDHRGSLERAGLEQMSAISWRMPSRRRSQGLQPALPG